MKKPSNVMKNKIYDKITYALPKHQFGGQMLDYFKSLVPKLNTYQGQTNGINGQSNLYSDDAQAYYKNLLYRNELTGKGLVYNDDSFKFIPNDPNNIPVGTKSSNPRDPNYDPNYIPNRNPTVFDPKSRQNYTGTTSVTPAEQQFQKEYRENISKQTSNQILETGVNIYSLMQGQEAYDNKPKDNLTPRNTGHQGFRYAQFGGNVNLTGYTPGTSSYNNPFNIIPDGNITTMNTPFPIFAKPNNGPGRVLTPGNNYNFKGAEYVTEIPLKQYGGDTNTIDPNNPVKPVINSPQYGLSIVQKYNKLTDITQDQFEKLDFDQQKLLLNNAINEINLKNKKPVSGKVIYEEKTPMVVAKQSEQKTNKYNNRENDPNFINWYAKQKNDTIQVYVDPDTGEQSEIKINRNNISNNIKNKKTNSNKQRVVQLASAAFNKKYGGKVTYLF